QSDFYRARLHEDAQLRGHRLLVTAQQSLFIQALFAAKSVVQATPAQSGTVAEILRRSTSKTIGTEHRNGGINDVFVLELPGTTRIGRFFSAHGGVREERKELLLAPLWNGHSNILAWQSWSGKTPGQSEPARLMGWTVIDMGAHRSGYRQWAH